jgi:transposase
LLAPAIGDEHDCAWHGYAEELSQELDSTRKDLNATQEQLDALKSQFEELQRKVFGKRSEKMPPMDREVRRDKEANQQQRVDQRRANAQLRAQQLQTEVVEVAVPEEQCRCPKCQGTQFVPIGKGKPSSVIEYISGYFRKRIYRRQTVACSCGQHFITAPVPDKVFDRTHYGPSFIAYLIVAKCCDCLPLYRLERQFGRLGIPMARSTLTELFNRAGELLIPLATAILQRVAEQPLVHADETPQPMQSGKRGYMWTFIGGKMIAYRFSPSRSGQTPQQVLGGTDGTLLVDMYTGYNVVTGTGQRERAGCMAHVRRKFFDSKKNASEAEVALEFIRQIYVIEAEVASADLKGTDQHAEVRWQQTLPIMDKFYIWLSEQKALHPPKSGIGKAIKYTMKNWQALTRFIRNTDIPPDNNRAENALRVVALLRKNSLFVGNKDAGKNLAALLTVVATCLANNVEPQAYLTDILTRLDSTPASQIDSLLPQEWVPRS